MISEYRRMLYRVRPDDVPALVDALVVHGGWTEEGAAITDLEPLLNVDPDNPQYGEWHGDGGTGIQCSEVYCEGCADGDN